MMVPLLLLLLLLLLLIAVVRIIRMLETVKYLINKKLGHLCLNKH